MAEEKKKQQRCMICGKASDKSICETCSERIRGEALNKKKKQEKVE